MSLSRTHVNTGPNARTLSTRLPFLWVNIFCYSHILVLLSLLLWLPFLKCWFELVFIKRILIAFKNIFILYWTKTIKLSRSCVRLLQDLWRQKMCLSLTNWVKIRMRIYVCRWWMPNENIAFCLIIIFSMWCCNILSHLLSLSHCATHRGTPQTRNCNVIIDDT